MNPDIEIDFLDTPASYKDLMSLVHFVAADRRVTDHFESGHLIARMIEGIRPYLSYLNISDNTG